MEFSRRVRRRKSRADDRNGLDAEMICHPERSEGFWFLPARTMLPALADTKTFAALGITSVIQDDKVCLRDDSSDYLICTSSSADTTADVADAACCGARQLSKIET